MRPAFSAAPGIPQATYDAVAAKLVAVGEWVDLTAAITTACAGAAASDPDSLKAGLTVTTTTGTFDGATIPCNEFAWTTHTTTNDGYSETLNIDLGTLLSHIATYVPATHGVQIVADFVAAGTLNSTRPIVAVGLAKAGVFANDAPVCGFIIQSATAIQGVTGMGNALDYATTAVNPTGLSVSSVIRHLRFYGGALRTVVLGGLSVAAGLAGVPQNIVDTFTTADKLFLLIGQDTTTQAAITGLKVRFRVRTFAMANIDFGDVDMGCEAAP